MSGGEKIGNMGDCYTPTGSITLYAQWSTTLTVYYIANGGSVSPSSVSATAGTSVTLPTPVRFGYVFDGWYTSLNNSNSKVGAAGDLYTIINNVTLYALWNEMTINEMLDNFEQDSTYQSKVSKYVDTTKKNTLLAVGRSLATYGYEPAFIAGFLGHITPEGNLGYFEKYWGSNLQSYLLDWESINLPDYVREYSGKYIMDKDLTTVQNIISVLESGGWQKKFGLGCCQWTAERTKTLVNSYYLNEKSSNNITYNEVVKAETKMINDELHGAIYNTIITKWKTICANENINLRSSDAAYWAGYCILIGYGLNPAKINTNNSPSYTDSGLSSTWISWANERGGYAQDIYKVMIGENIT